MEITKVKEEITYGARLTKRELLMLEIAMGEISPSELRMKHIYGEPLQIGEIDALYATLRDAART